MEHSNYFNKPSKKNESSKEGEHSLSQLAMDYYKKYGQKRDIKQYFILSSQISDSEEMIEKSQDKLDRIAYLDKPKTTPSPSFGNEYGQNKERKKWTRPTFVEPEHLKITPPKQDIGFDEISETARMSSPASSVASHKRLEWDSGADVGYYNNYISDKKRDRFNSLPILSSMERSVLRQRILGIEAKDLPTTSLVKAHSMQYSAQGIGQDALTESPESVKQDLKKVGLPKAESTLVPSSNPFFYNEGDSELTPIAHNVLKTPINRDLLLENEQHLIEMNVKVSNEGITKKFINFEDKQINQSNLDISGGLQIVVNNTFASNTNNQHNNMQDKDSQTTLKKSTCQSIQVQEFSHDVKVEDYDYANIDPLEGTSRMHLEEFRFSPTEPNNVDIPKSNSFEYLPGDTYEHILNSDDCQSVSQSSNQNSYIPVEAYSPVDPTNNLRKVDGCYRLNSASSSAGDVTDGSFKSHENRYVEPQHSTNLSTDLEHTINALKNLVKKKHYTAREKKQLVKKIVKKIVETQYDDDIDDESNFQKNNLSNNVPWVPATYTRKKQDYSTSSSEKSSKEIRENKVKFSTTQNLKTKNDQTPSSVEISNHSSSEESIIQRIYKKLGLRENSRGLLEKIPDNSNEKKYEETTSCGFIEGEFDDTNEAGISKKGQYIDRMAAGDELRVILSKIESKTSESEFKKQKSHKLLKNNPSDPGPITTTAFIEDAEPPTASQGPTVTEKSSSTCDEYKNIIDWKKSRTLSEKLFEVRAKYLHDQRHAKILLPRGIPLSNQATLYPGYQFPKMPSSEKTNPSSNITKSPLESYVLEFAEEERINRLLWIDSEIKHLHNLKSLIETEQFVQGPTQPPETLVYSVHKTKPHRVQIQNKSSSEAGLNETLKSSSLDEQDSADSVTRAELDLHTSYDPHSADILGSMIQHNRILSDQDFVHMPEKEESYHDSNRSLQNEIISNIKKILNKQEIPTTHSSSSYVNKDVWSSNPLCLDKQGGSIERTKTECSNTASHYSLPSGNVPEDRSHVDPVILAEDIKESDAGSFDPSSRNPSFIEAIPPIALSQSSEGTSVLQQSEELDLNNEQIANYSEKSTPRGFSQTPPPFVQLSLRNQRRKDSFTQTSPRSNEQHSLTRDSDFQSSVACDDTVDNSTQTSPVPEIPFRIHQKSKEFEFNHRKDTQTDQRDSPSIRTQISDEFQMKKASRKTQTLDKQIYNRNTKTQQDIETQNNQRVQIPIVQKKTTSPPLEFQHQNIRPNENHKSLDRKKMSSQAEFRSQSIQTSTIQKIINRNQNTSPDSEPQYQELKSQNTQTNESLVILRPDRRISVESEFSFHSQEQTSSDSHQEKTPSDTQETMKKETKSDDHYCQNCGKRKKSHSSSLRHRIQEKINNCERCKKQRDHRGEIPEFDNKHENVCHCLGLRKYELSPYLIDDCTKCIHCLEGEMEEKWEKERMNMMRNECQCRKHQCGRRRRVEPPPPSVAYYLTFESREDVRSQEGELSRKQSLDEIKVFVPKTKTASRVSKKCTLSREEGGHGLPDAYADWGSHKHRTSLQEYLQKNRPEFIQAADTRRKWLADSTIIRDVRSVRRRKLLNIANDSKLIQRSVSSFFRDYKLPKSPYQKRIFSTKAMREMTKRHCKVLPEVQEKIFREHIEKEARANRLMMQIFNKKLQKRVHKGQVSLAYSVSVASNL